MLRRSLLSTLPGWARVSRGRCALLAVSLVLAGCDGEPGGAASEPVAGADALRRQAAALFVEGREAQAAEVLTSLVERPDAGADDLLRAAIAELGAAHHERAWALNERAFALAPDDLGVLYNRGNLLSIWKTDPQAAAEVFARVVVAHPEDAAARIQLGIALKDSNDVDGAIEQFEAVRALGVEFAGSYYVTATYQLYQVLSRRGRTAEAQPLADEHKALVDRGIRGASVADSERGSLGQLRPPSPTVGEAGPPSTAALPVYTVAQSIALAHRGTLVARDLDDDGRVDILGFDEFGLSVALQGEDGEFTVSNVDSAPGQRALGDLDNDGPLELAVTSGGSVALFTLVEGRYVPWKTARLEVADATSATFVDFDHDGDLDLAVTTAGDGLRLIRNDGDGLLVDATVPAAAALGATERVYAAEIDGDNDVDFLVVTAGRLAALSNLRRGEFENVTAKWSLPDGVDDLPVVDVDGDGRSDLVVSSGDDLRWHAFDGVAFGAGASIGTLPAGTTSWQLDDVDLDGRVDVFGSGPDGLWVMTGPLAYRTAPVAARPLSGVPGGAVVARDVLGQPADPDTPADVDPRPTGDGHLELIVAPAEAEVVVLSNEAARGVSLDLRGQKDNLHGVGAVIEAFAGDVYRRVDDTGARVVLGTGTAGRLDIVRITWPNGVVQHRFDVLPGADQPVLQVDRNVGSCPFLYTWNGSRWVFVTDVLGTTPLGLPMTAEQMVPFDHEEYVRVRGDQLAPRDGRLSIALTEEMREVTYLDQVRLHVIDHPAGVEIQPHEGFVMPPFPEHHVHTFSEVLAPARVRADDGSDVTAALAAIDDHCAQPFERLPLQFRGLCEPWAIELDFGRDAAERDAITSARKLRLALTGWVEWGDASVNLSAARHPRYAFEPPVLWVPDVDGWRALGPPFGFPAGKTKTMVVDLTDELVRTDPRLRITTTLALSWDAIRLVLDDDDAPFTEIVLEPLAADLGYRGFSEPLVTDRTDLPERFEWDRLASRPPWDQHAGMYTRYGDVLPLLGATDDRYIIMGAGDAAHMDFDAGRLSAPPAGWVRDYLLYLDGWAKDGDLNTQGAERVEPLPFHAMDGYPPANAATFLETEATAAWQREWNTRPGRRLMGPLASGRPAAARR